MTEKETEVKHWLERAFYAGKKLIALDMLLKRSVMHAEGLSRSGQYNYTGKPEVRLNGTQGAFLTVAGIEHDFIEQKKELVKIYTEISETIALLHDDELEAVLMHRYLMFRTIEETAEIMHYSPRTIKYKQKQAIEKLCPFLPCIAP